MGALFGDSLRNSSTERHTQCQILKHMGQDSRQPQTQSERSQKDCSVRFERISSANHLVKTYMMNIFLLIISLVFAVTAGSPLISDISCPVCEQKFCPKTEEECPLGTVVDQCGCCPHGFICLLKVGDRCLDTSYTTEISHTDLGRYGSCGNEMVCQKRTDINPMRDLQQSICTCINNRQVCGSDNKTYDNSCLLTSAAPSNVKLVHQGPCSQPPLIAVGPSNGISNEGESIALDCEVHGVPVPTITWQFIARDGVTHYLPGDDTSIVVQTRGGPESSMLTSWVQIMYADIKNSGTYVCVASNGQEIAKSAARVQVKPTM